MDELLEQFLIEGRDLVAQAQGAIITLARDGNDRSALDGLFRAVHTLKGSVALFDMGPAETMLHGAESRLDTVRRAKIILDQDLLDALVAAMDQTDRWIDAMESAGRLDTDAPGAAAAVLALLAPPSTPAARLTPLDEPPERVFVPQEWTSALRKRPELAGHAARGSGVMFRYLPDPECFFRGEDPLSFVAAVPELLAIAVIPSAEAWPDLAGSEPFHCFAAIEGVSGANEDAVRASFRLVPEQVTTAPFSNADMSVGALPEGGASDASNALLRVEAAVLDRLATESGELAVASRAFAPLITRAHLLEPALAADLRNAHQEIERIAGSLQRSIARARLVSLEPSLRRLPRLSRETAAALHKRVRFSLFGETSKVDKQVADQIFEPLLHLVRNAIDHGIELPAIREGHGKSAMGEISLTIRQDGKSIHISVTDDGAGMDASHLRDAVVNKGLLSREAADRLGETQALELIFMPGFSTANKITDVSGRGVGMDVVKTAIEALSGTITIASTPGVGTRFDLRVPMNAISNPLLVVEAGGEYLGIRIDQIVETTRIAAGDIQAVGQGRVCVHRDTAVPVLDLAEMLGLGPIAGDQARLIITEIAGNRTAIRVNALAERFDAVIREPSSLLGAMSRIGGTAQRADGSLVLVLDLAELIS